MELRHPTSHVLPFFLVRTYEFYSTYALTYTCTFLVPMLQAPTHSHAHIHTQCTHTPMHTYSPLACAPSSMYPTIHSRECGEASQSRKDRSLWGWRGRDSFPEQQFTPDQLRGGEEEGYTSRPSW